MDLPSCLDKQITGNYQSNDDEGQGGEKRLIDLLRRRQKSMLLYTLQVWLCCRHLQLGYSLWLIFSPFCTSASTGLTTKESDNYLGAPDKIAAEQDSLTGCCFTD